MVQTRSGAGASGLGPEEDAPPSDPSESPPSSDDDSEGHASEDATDLESLGPALGSLFDYRQMTPSSEERARKAFDAEELSMSHCRFWDFDGRSYFNFNLREQIGIRIGPLDEGVGTATCTCRQPSPCKHIWWLEYQLVQGQDPQRNWAFVNDASTVSGIPLYEWILQNGIDRLSASRHWPLVAGAAELGESYPRRRDEELSEMLSPFAPLAADELAYRDAYEALDQVFRDFADSDRGVFESLRSALDPDLTAQARFERTATERVRQAFETLDLVARVGPPNHALDQAPVPACASALEEVINEIQATIRTNTNAIAVSTALSLLLQILQGVVTRNADIYVGKPWATSVQAPTDGRNRNLYARLVRPPPPQPQLFLVDALRQIPPDLLNSRRDSFLRIMEQVRKNGGPDRYYTALRDLIAPKGGPPTIGKKRVGDPGEGSSQPKRGR
jgi:hypothetical protein